MRSLVDSDSLTGCLSLCKLGTADRSCLKKGDPAERTSLCAPKEVIAADADAAEVEAEVEAQSPAGATRVTSE